MEQGRLGRCRAPIAIIPTTIAVLGVQIRSLVMQSSQQFEIESVVAGAVHRAEQGPILVAGTLSAPDQDPTKRTRKRNLLSQ